MTIESSKKGQSKKLRYLAVVGLIMSPAVFAKDNLAKGSVDDQIIILRQDAQKLKNEILSVKEEVSRNENQDKMLGNFQDKIYAERQSHQNFVESIYSNFMSYIERIIGVSALLFMVLAWWFGRNAKNTIEDILNKKLKDAEDDIDKNVESFRASIAKLKGDLENQRSYLQQNITYFSTSKDNELKAEIGLLRDAGFNIKNVGRGIQRLLIVDDISDTDILLISANDSDDLVKIFETINNSINLVAKKIPLVIYVKGRSDSFMKLQEIYPWVISSNMPLTLVNSIFTVSKIKSLT